MEAIATKNIDIFLEQFGEAESVLPKSLVQEARTALENTDFPTRKTEAWKYTPVGKIARGHFTFNNTQVELPKAYEAIGNRIVFVNGFWDESLSNIKSMEGVTVDHIQNTENASIGKNVNLKQEPFHCMNTLLCQGGVSVKIDANQKVETPIYIIHLVTGEGSIAVNRHFVEAGESSEAEIVQLFSDENAKKCFTNCMTEANVAKNAHLTISKVQSESEENYHINTEQIAQDRDAQFDILTFTLNGALVRNNLNIDVNGENCLTNLSGAYLGKGKQHIDNHTIVDHKVPNCESNELYKGVMNEKSTAVFNGKVFVRKDAQKINAFQSNKNVLLGENATVNSKPELEIYADDVKCSHGSTTGQMDEEAVFYLMSRGLSEKSARNLMVRAFIGELVDQLENEILISYISDITEERFGWGFKKEV